MTKQELEITVLLDVDILGTIAGRVCSGHPGTGAGNEGRGSGDRQSYQICSVSRRSSTVRYRTKETKR